MCLVTVRVFFYIFIFYIFFYFFIFYYLLYFFLCSLLLFLYVFVLYPVYDFLINKLINKKRRRKHCALAVVRRSQKFSPAAEPLSRGAGRSKLNQLEMVRHYLYLQTQFGEDRCTQFRLIVVTHPHTHKHTHPPQTRQGRLQYTAPQLR